jgi:leucyl-tRNA synthetase
MEKVVSLVKEGKNPSCDRCYDVAQYYRRINRIQNREPYFADDNEKTDRIFLSLYNKHRLLIKNNNNRFFDVYYLPSPQAGLSVFKNGDNHNWPANIHNRQKKAFRVTKGVIIKCPLEDGGGAIDVFSTDWAPFASACAVAIHSQHPWAGYWGDTDNYFTGRFVRHPLTGDLIPVHVADWVKPDFGTGAVLINPGHDDADLKYARQIGLPIRFSIAPESFDGTPSTWLSPPVKTGQSTKTGFYDGIPQNELAHVYLKKLKEFNLAESHHDCQAGMWPIGRLFPPDTAPTPGDSSITLDLPDKNAHFKKNILEPLNLLTALATISQKPDPIIVTPGSEIEKSLLGLRMAYYDASDCPLIPERIEIVQGVNDSGLSNHKTFRMAAFVGAKANEVSTPRKQLIEQVERFVIQHEKLNQIKSSDIEKIHPTPLWKLAAQTLHSIDSGGYSRAFSNLYKLQKELLNVEIEKLPSEPGFQAYFVITYILLGLGQISRDFDSHGIYKKLVGP